MTSSSFVVVPLLLALLVALEQAPGLLALNSEQALEADLEVVDILPRGETVHHHHHRHHQHSRVHRQHQQGKPRRSITPFALLDSQELPAACEEVKFAPHERCPDECPFAAEVEKSFCHFKCVKDKECGIAGLVGEATIPDEEKHECRRCEVEGCKTCKHGDPGMDVEFCDVCMPGYIRSEDGKECTRMSDWIFLGIAGVVGVFVVLGLCWYMDLASKPIVNQASIDVAHAHRSRTKVRQEGVEGRPLWPPGTNLCTTDVAGVGTVVFFRFQAAILIWAIFGFLMQLAFGFLVSQDIFVLGAKPAVTPQEFCDVIKWGRARQMELIWTKVTWLAIFYPFSFIGAIIYGISCSRLFVELDNRNMTMSDYVALVRGVPRMSGKEKVEEILKLAIEEASSEKLVGVSCGWDVPDHDTEHHIIEAIDVDMTHLEEKWLSKHEGGGAPPTEDNGQDKKGEEEPAEAAAKKSEGAEEEDAWTEAPEARAWRRSGLSGIFDVISLQVLAKWKAFCDDTPEEHDAHHIKEMVEHIDCSEYAFAVFENESSRDRALQKCKENGIMLNGASLILELEENEPQGIVWEHVGVSESQLTWNLVKAVFWMSVTVVIWVVVLYLPYEFWMRSFSFANGDEPGEMAEIIFIGLVVGAQIGLFVTANILAHHAGFIYEDNHQSAYILLYNGALIVNLVFDLCLTAFLGYNQMVGRGVHTADGRLLGDLPNLQQIFESYPMQKAIGSQLKKYCWPATFFIPFSVEPLLAIWLPWHLGKLFIRSHPHLVGRKAERVMVLPVIEQGRFADLIFNSILVCCVPFFAPAYIHKLFGFLIFSHLYIYAFDHVRVLRNITRFHFSSNVCNIQGQQLFSIPCGLLAAALVFKYNQMKGDPHKLGSGPLQGPVLWQVLAGVFFGHIVIHLLCLKYIVPLFCLTDRPPETRPYSECAKQMPASWFSVNPVHCLRSKYIYNHSPPQTYYVIGKEHLAEKNESIGAYFETEPAELEDYSKTSLF
eukprot:CAMPEP_0206547360 /NCGR_PEP_ID=MMETSP0325_2-20121206/13251_1 /ASSEMBLY_ACC=CAM_ASM_000347 /TAXON_ID=2866 /ORGANISM="Crypthecodinium cohnii, Strain Seligo" /LENGTH=995 /DNA_ID=CAMNT_0054046653 /DNA_START=46 /DNA_END=3033 /DNA_ORIENTATION=-